MKHKLCSLPLFVWDMMKKPEIVADKTEKADSLYFYNGVFILVEKYINNIPRNNIVAFSLWKHKNYNEVIKAFFLVGIALFERNEKFLTLHGKIGKYNFLKRILGDYCKKADSWYIQSEEFYTVELNEDCIKLAKNFIKDR